ncbi:MAG: glycosyltransferase family 39 protein [Chloroflexota bacterium]|nr:glycosyltransferase family 39 protein [Dehalococcoidia bacterium]MDW8253488.1 glycosyltransferase family 39 protein [Chloroflexota bacterium]
MLLCALGVRLAGLSDLVLFGDAAASVFFAMQGWGGIAPATAVDSHPPGYYYLLRLSLDLIGWNELGARLPSLFCGVLLVALLLAAGRQLAGAGAGTAVGLLAAISPTLVVSSRQPRMYALLALLSLLVLLLAARPQRSWRHALALLVFAWAALMTHYFAVVVIVAAAVVALLSSPVGARSLRRGDGGGAGSAVPPARSTGERRTEVLRALAAAIRSLWPFGGAGALWLPWLASALGESLRHTERTIAGVAPQPTALHFLGSLAVAVPVGTFVPLVPAVLLALLWWAVAGGALLSARRWPRWPLLAAGAVLVGATAIYVAQPLFGRPRFFIGLVPLVLLAIAVPLAALRRSWALLAGGALAVITLLALAMTLPVERGMLEPDAVRLGEELAGASAQDAVILQPWWQAGYLRIRLDPLPRLVAMRDLPPSEWPALLGEGRQLWLVFTGVGRRDPAFPLEEWLDRAAYRVDERMIGALRVARYVAAPDPLLPPPTALPNGLAIAAAPASRELTAGAPLPVLVSWEASRSVEERVVLFLHLRGQDGSGWAGRDEEPDTGMRLSGQWAAGERLLERRGLVVPAWTPPGVYRVVAGAYRRSDGGRIGNDVDLGEVRVRRAPSTGRTLAVFDNRFALEAVRLLPSDAGAARRTTIETVDGPQTLFELSTARAGQALTVVLNWRLVGPAAPAVASLRLLDQHGRVVAEREQPPAGPADPPALWAAEGVASGRFDLALSGSLPRGRYQLQLRLLRPDGAPLPVQGREALTLGWVALDD